MALDAKLAGMNQESSSLWVLFLTNAEQYFDLIHEENVLVI